MKGIEPSTVGWKPTVLPLAPHSRIEQMKGIEPSSSAWQADIIPVYDICVEPGGPFANGAFPKPGMLFFEIFLRVFRKFSSNPSSLNYPFNVRTNTMKAEAISLLMTLPRFFAFLFLHMQRVQDSNLCAPWRAICLANRRNKPLSQLSILVSGSGTQRISHSPTNTG